MCTYFHRARINSIETLRSKIDYVLVRMFSSYSKQHNSANHAGGTGKSRPPSTCMASYRYHYDGNKDDDDADTVATEIIDDVPYCMRRGNLERHHLMYAVDHRLVQRSCQQHEEDDDDQDEDCLLDEQHDVDADKNNRYEMPPAARAARIGSRLQRQVACSLLLLVGVFLAVGVEVKDMQQTAQRVWHHGGHIAQRALCSTGPTALVANHAHRALSSLSMNYDDQSHHRQLCESKYPCVPDPTTGSIQHCTKNNVAGWWISVTNMYYMEQYIANNIAYVLTITECPSDGQISSKWNSNTDATSLSVIYDTYSVFKAAVCNCSLDDREGNVNYNSTSKYGYTMIALIHPSATMCPDANGDMVDMVKTAQEIGYIPRIWDEDIYAEELGVNRDYFLSHPDYSNRDLIYLHAVSMTNFPLVVLSEPTRMMLEPIDEVYDALLADESLRAAYVEDATGHIDLGMAVIKPSVADSEALQNAYQITPFDPVTGWGGSGYGGGGIDGGMTSKGILTYFYKSYLPSSTAATTFNLDRCVYGNGGDSGCAQVSTDNVKVVHIDSDECGEPWECNAEAIDANPRCRDIAYEWFRKRLDYELYRWEKSTTQTRDGTLETDVYQGYCTDAGESGYKPMLVDENMDTWAPADSAILGEFLSKVSCESAPACPVGQYMMIDCGCSSNPCDACPPGTHCQNVPGYPALCVDCTCGACDAGDQSCCDYNDQNNCKANPKAQNTECNLQNGWFSSLDGTGNTCSGVEISLQATPNGCGCQPSETEPCTYDPAERTLDDRCYICDANDLVGSDIVGSKPCDTCKACLANCHSCVETAVTATDMVACLDSDAMNGGNADPECRESCSSVCTKIQL